MVKTKKIERKQRERNYENENSKTNI